MKRTILIQNPGTLSMHEGQMVFISPDAEPQRVPVEDIGLVMIESRQVTITQPLIVGLADSNVPLICCDAAHSPAGIFLPMKGHCSQGEIVRKQLDMMCGSNISDALWKEIVRRKIAAQTGFLAELDVDTEKMCGYLSGVTDDGTTENAVAMEGAAARYYFNGVFGSEFRRNRYGRCPNDFLNYGYTVLRALVTRELVSAGLFLGIGLYHSNRNNEFPLVDDVIEPYRVFVDRIVHDMFRDKETDFDTRTRSRLLQVLATEVRMGGIRHNLSDAVGMTASSVRKILTGEEGLDCLAYPDVL